MSRFRSFGRLLLAAALTCVYLFNSMAIVAYADVSSTPTTTPTAALPCPVAPGHGEPGRALILIQGMFSRGTSEHLWQHVTEELDDIYGGFIYYSYSGRAHDYTVSDTLESIGDHDVPLLHALIGSCRDVGWTSFDIAGHSKGGVVAVEYVKAFGLSGDQADLVRNVITLDAPVNGSELAWLVLHGPARSLPSPLWSANLDMAVAVVELAHMYDQRDDVIRRNEAAAQAMQESGRCLYTITNDQDVAISRADAIIEGFGRSYDLGIELRGDTGRRLGHHRTLDLPNETTEMDDVRACLTGRSVPETANAEVLTGLDDSVSDFVSSAARALVALLPLARP